MAQYRTRAVGRLWILFFGEQEFEALAVDFIPMRVTWRNNSDRMADECDVSIDARELRGLDPRGIHSIRLEIWCDDTPNGQPPRMVDEALRFVGFVDEPELQLDERTNELKLTARDYTALLIDAQVPAEAVRVDGELEFRAKTYDLDVTFREFVAQILADAGGAADLWRWPVSKAVGKRALDNSARAALPSPGGLVPFAALTDWTLDLSRRLWIDPGVSSRNVASVVGTDVWPTQSGESLWDVLSRVSDLMGVVPTFERDWLWIRKPSDYTGGTYHMAYGKNLTSLTLRKNLTAGVSRQIFEVRCLVPSATTAEESIRVGVWPPRGQLTVDERVRAHQTKSLAAQGQPNPSAEAKVKQVTVQDMVTRFLVDGERSVQELTDLAEYFYTQAIRQDVQGDLTTTDVLDLGFPTGHPVHPGKGMPLALPETQATAHPKARLVDRLTGRILDAVRAGVSAVAQGGSSRDVLQAARGRGASAVKNPRRAWDDLSDFDEDVVVVATARGPTSVMGMRNSSLVYVQNLIDPDDAFKPGKAWIDTEAGRSAREAVRRSRIAADTAVRCLYVKEAEHHWDRKTGYELKAKVTSVVGTDTGGPTLDGRSDVDLLP